MQQTTLKRIKVHLFFWVSFCIYSLLIDYFTGEYVGVIAHFLYIAAHHWIIFYSSYFIIRFSDRFGSRKALKRLILFFLSFCLFILVHFAFRMYLQQLLVKPFIPLTNYLSHFLYGITWYVQYFFMAAGFIFFENAQQSQLKLAISEKQRLQTEANFLRAQINPHFLQNTLNFFYAQSLPVNAPKLSEGILLLSDMMRYSLSGQGDSQARVLLRDEIRHLQNFIAINQLRFSGQLQVNFSVQGDPGDSTLIPLALVTLLENAFKHGDLSDPQHPLQVQLLLDCPDAWLNFDVFNRIRTGPAEKSSRIGIENTRRRLDMAYPGNYQLETGAAGLDFHARLKIFRQQV